MANNLSYGYAELYFIPETYITFKPMLYKML